MRVAVTSIACEKLAKENVAIPNGWNFYTMQDRVRVNEWNPDVEICLGWFCSGWTDWQAHKANFGDTKKIIIQWVGTDILTIKQSYELGHKMIVKWLDDHRFTCSSRQGVLQRIGVDGTQVVRTYGCPRREGDGTSADAGQDSTRYLYAT